MSSISMEWLGGPIVLNLKEDEIMADLDQNWSPELPSASEAASDAESDARVERKLYVVR